MANEKTCQAHSGMTYAVGIMGTVILVAICAVADLLWRMQDNVAEIRGGTAQIICQLNEIKSEAKAAMAEAHTAVLDARKAASEAKEAAVNARLAADSLRGKDRIP